MSKDLPDLSRTAKAIEERDRMVPLLYDKIDRGSGKYDDKYIEEIEALERAVGEAFGEDTKDRNNPQTCAEVIRAGPPSPSPGSELSFVRRMVAKWRKMNGQ